MYKIALNIWDYMKMYVEGEKDKIPEFELKMLEKQEKQNGIESIKQDLKKHFRFGLGIIKKKLKALEEKFKIEIVYVNPAYTSQQCSCCGYVAKTNRKTRDRFVCDHCKRKIHADVNGARSTLSRGSDKGITIYMSKEKVLDVITKRFYDCRVSLASGKICIERQSARCPSRWASELMSRNLYYTRQSWFGSNQLHKEVLHELTKNSG